MACELVPNHLFRAPDTHYGGFSAQRLYFLWRLGPGSIVMRFLGPSGEAGLTAVEP